MRSTAIAVGVAAAIMLLAHPAQAETRVYVNLGIPAVHIAACQGDCGGGYVWIEGSYELRDRCRVWVPGHWRGAGHHAVHAPRPRVVHNTYVTNNYYSSAPHPRPGNAPGHAGTVYHHGQWQHQGSHHGTQGSLPAGRRPVESWKNNVRYVVND